MPKISQDLQMHFVAVSFLTVSVLSKPTCCEGVLCGYHYTVLRMKGLKKSKTNVIIVVLGPQDIHQVLMTLIQGGVEYPDPVVSNDCDIYIIHTYLHLFRTLKR